MLNRYDNPIQLNYQSQFVPTQIPWELLQGKAERLQNKQDNLKISEAKLGDLQAVGKDYITDHFGNTRELGDYSASYQEVNQLNEKLNNLATKYAKSERGSQDYWNEFTSLNKEYNAIKQKNALREKRSAAIDELYKNREKNKINAGDIRGIYDQYEIDKMISDKSGTYTPTLGAYQDVLDENKFVNDVLANTNSEVLADFAKNKGLYIEEYKRTGILPKKITDAFFGAFETSAELKTVIENEALTLAYQNGANVNDTIKLQDGTETTYLEYVKNKKYNQMLQHSLKGVKSDVTHNLSSDASAIYEDKKRQETMPVTALNLTNVKSDFEIAANTSIKYDNYSKGEKRLFEINAKLAKFKNGVSINNASEYDALMKEKEILMNQKASFEGTMNNVINSNINKFKESLYKDTELKISEAQSVIDMYNNPTVTRDGRTNKPSQESYNQARKDLETLNRNKEAIRNAKSRESIESLIAGTSVENTYNSLVFDAMKANEKQQEYTGYIIQDKNDIKALHGLLRLANIDYEGLNGEMVSFSGKFENSAQIGFTPDGKPFVTIVEDEGNFGISNPKTKTVVLDPRNKTVEAILRKNVNNAAQAYYASGGTDVQAKSVMDRGIVSLSSLEPIVANSKDMPQTLGSWQKNVVNSQPGQLNYMTIKDIPVDGELQDLVFVASNNEDGTVKVNVAKKTNENTLLYFDPFIGTKQEGRQNFEDIYQAISKITNGE